MKPVHPSSRMEPVGLLPGRMAVAEARRWARLGASAAAAEHARRVALLTREVQAGRYQPSAAATALGMIRSAALDAGLRERLRPGH